MKTFSYAVLWLLALPMVLGISSCREDELLDGTGEMVFYNGTIYTVDTANSYAEAVIVKDGIITFVGSEAEAENIASEDAEWIDLEQAFMMPGIHDVHMHPLEAASDNFKFILDVAIEDPELYIDDITIAHDENPGTDWLLGWGHLLETIIEANRNPKEILDDVSTSRPIAVMEQTSHSLWVNSKALELLNFNANTIDPIGGIIMKDENGNPNGILIDNAGEICMSLALAPTSERMQNDYNGLVEYALPELAKHGITSVSEARTFWKRDQHEIWQKIEEDGLLTCRINLGLWAYPEANDADQLAAIQALYSNDSNSLLRINQIKVYVDGIIHNTTAAMHDDYLIDYFENPTNNGLNYFESDRLAEYISVLESTGFDFHIHALGNLAIHEALNSIEQGGSNAGRHRITHVEYVDPSDIPRFAQLNVTADAQVVGEFTQPANWHENDYLVGASLASNIIPIKSLSDASARITLSSDWDVSDLNPFVGIQNAVTRTPQNISLEQAIRAYTINGAYTMRQENKVGSIQVGKEADLIVINQNPFEIAPTEIGQTEVYMTFLKGRLVYEK